MATMSIEQMKWALMPIYPPSDWQADVDAMSDAQTYSTYMRMLSAGEIRIRRIKR